MSSVQIRDVRKSFGAFEVLHGVTVPIEDGEFVVLVGPSGCGKSTLLRMLAGLENITSGTISIGDRVVNNVQPKERDIAMVFQNYALYPHMTVADNMGFSLKLRGASADEISKGVKRAAEILALTPLLERYPRQLSGGQRQRVAMGRAIVRKPRVFLFDEPLSNLDAALRVNMRIELSRLHRELGTTMIYVTHDQVEAMTMGTRIAVFNQGRIEQLGAPLSLYNAPANEFVAAFLGAPRINLIELPGHDATPVQRALWSLLLPRADAAVRRAGVRAEHLRVGAFGTGVPATVVMAEHLGDVSVLHLRVDGIPELLHAKVDASHAHLAAGASVGLMPVAESVLAFDGSGQRIG